MYGIHDFFMYTFVFVTSQLPRGLKIDVVHYTAGQ